MPPPNLVSNPKDLPRYLFDPRWDDPRMAGNFAFQLYRMERFRGREFQDVPLIPSADLFDLPKKYTDRRTFDLAPVHVFEQWGNMRFRGGAFNELYRRYNFGNRLPTVNFHAKYVAFGADQDGCFLVKARIGRFGGMDGNDAALEVRFFAEEECIGGLLWRGSMDPPDDRDITLAGRAEELAARFEDLTEARVAFFGFHDQFEKGSPLD